MRTSLGISLLGVLLTMGACAAAPELTGQAARFADFRAGKDAPTCRAVLVETPPVVDGRMAAAYKAAAPLQFVVSNGEKRKPTDATSARVVCTKDALYVLFRCRYSDPGAVKWSRRTHDDSVWNDNCVEVFLEPTGAGSRNYYQVTVNPGGTLADSLARDHKAWNPRLKVKTKVEPGEWTAELAIPFDQLGPGGTKVNKVWRMNLTRFNLAPAEDTSWCVLGDYNSHVPSKFGYLWVDAGSEMNVSPQEMQPWRPIFNGRNLGGWKVERGRVSVRGGMMVVPPSETAVVLLKKPLPYGDFLIGAEVMSDKQFRFMFSPDPGNEKMGFYATFINLINESNVALMRRWEYWVPPLGGHLTIPHYGPCPMRDNVWYRCEVRFRPDRTSLLLNGRVLLETPNMYPQARYFGVHIIGGGKVRNIRIRKLVSSE